MSSDTNLRCIGCGKAVGEVHGEECPIGFILKAKVDEGDCYEGRD